MKTTRHAELSSMLFIAGTAIGAGVLGIPISLGGAGIFWAITACIVLYVIILSSGIIFAQLFCEYHQRDLPTFFRRHLGQLGFTIFSLAFFSLFFSLLIAYWTALHSFFSGKVVIPLFLGCGVIILLRLGSRAVGHIMSLLTIGLIITFFLLAWLALRHGKQNLWTDGQIMAANRALPVILCSYGFQGAIPIVCRQMDFCRHRIRRVIIGGTLIPLFFNIVILLVAMKTLSQAELTRGGKEGLSVFLLFREKFFSSSLLILGTGFSLCAIGSSLLGVTEAMKGALKDVFHRLRCYGSVFEGVILVALPILIARQWSGIFIAMLELAGGISLNLIAVILPMIIAIRQRRNPFIASLLLGSCVYILLLELKNLLRYL